MIASSRNKTYLVCSQIPIVYLRATNTYSIFIKKDKKIPKDNKRGVAVFGCLFSYVIIFDGCFFKVWNELESFFC